MILTKFNIHRISGLKKFIICMFLSITVYIILYFFEIDFKSRILLSWDTFCISMIIHSWILFLSTNQDELCGVVAEQDDGLKIIFLVVIIGICFSLVGTLVLINSNGESISKKLFHTIVSLSPVILSWILLHTTFSIRYAHLFHDHNKLKTGSNVGGIDFPGKQSPDYIDFAYFSFVIGMTFQVSDVVITSKVIRRFVLIHSLLSFIFNTVIVALTINTIADLQ